MHKQGSAVSAWGGQKFKIQVLNLDPRESLQTLSAEKYSPEKHHATNTQAVYIRIVSDGKSQREKIALLSMVREQLMVNLSFPLA